MAEFDKHGQQEEKLTGSSSGSWLFYKSIACVLGGLVVLVAILSPSWYLSSWRNTKEAWFERAEKLLKEEKLDEAIEAYEKVRGFEKKRERVFVIAESNIRKIKELQRIQEEDGGESGDLEEAKDPTGEGEKGDGTPEEGTDGMKPEDELQKAGKDDEDTDEDGRPDLDHDF